jgi:hypothetical protein
MDSLWFQNACISRTISSRKQYDIFTPPWVHLQFSYTECREGRTTGHISLLLFLRGKLNEMQSLLCCVLFRFVKRATECSQFSYCDIFKNSDNIFYLLLNPKRKRKRTLCYSKYRYEHRWMERKELYLFFSGQAGNNFKQPQYDG